MASTWFSLLVKLTGIAPSVAFNLAIPSLFAMTVSGAFGVGLHALGPLPSPRRQAGIVDRRAAGRPHRGGLRGGDG